MATKPASGPDFLCVGMPKCGTSTLHNLLQDCSEVVLPPIKEIHFHSRQVFGGRDTLLELAFGSHWMARQERLETLRELRKVLVGRASAEQRRWLRKFLRWPRDIDWYRGLFPADQICGSVTPSYHALRPAEIGALREQFPQLRIVIMLRNPYDQIWSHARMTVGRTDGDDRLSELERRVAEQLDHCDSYCALIERWRSAFGERVGVFYLEEMQADQDGFLANILAFLAPEGVRHQPPSVAKGSNYKVFVGKPANIPDRFRQTLLDAAEQRLAGFERIDPDRHAAWQSELARIAKRPS